MDHSFIRGESLRTRKEPGSPNRIGAPNWAAVHPAEYRAAPADSASNPPERTRLVTAPGRIIPEPLSAAAQARPRDASGRVIAPIRIEVRFSGGRGYRHYCDTLAEVAKFLASPSFTRTSAAVKSVVIVCQDPDPGPSPDEPQRRPWMAA